VTSAQSIRARLDDLALEITSRHDLASRFGPLGRQRCLEDARFHLQYLATALEAGSPALFLDYTGWTKVLLGARNIPERDLIHNLEVTAAVLQDLPDAVEMLYAAIEQLPSMPADVAGVLDPRAPLWTVASAYLTALLAGNRTDALQLVTRALDDGATLRDVYRHVFEPVQQEIGRLWQLNQVSVAQEHYCTAATQHIMTQLYGRMFGGGERTGRRAIAMCVGGELHEVGLRIITDLLELDGWHTWYLGASVPPAAAVQLCVERKADVLLVSATLPPHIAAVGEVIRLFRARPELAAARVIVGGRAFHRAPDLWRTIGADGYAANADDCLTLLSA
jgi:MerR family transcriptional regulator, light-induced transcriptional regulator